MPAAAPPPRPEMQMLEKLALATGMLSVLLFTAANAAQPAKSKAPAIQRTLAFDGRYSGLMAVTRELSGPGCKDIPVENFVINGGVIRSDHGAASLQPVFDGFVTDEGFVRGHVRIVDALATFE